VTVGADLAGDLPADLAAVVRDLGLEAYPHLIEHAAYYLRPPSGDRTGACELGLDLILDGLARAGDRD